MNTTTSIAQGYSQTGERWSVGPARIYNRLAEVLLDSIQIRPGCLALDLGAGTGAAAAALRRAGADVVAADGAEGMLRVDQRRRPPAAVGDAAALPFADGAFELVVAAFSINHLLYPEVGLREAARVTQPAGTIVASAYAAADDHPVKGAVYAAAASFGWTAPDWQRLLRSEAMPRLATVDRARQAAADAGLDAHVEQRVVGFPDLCAVDLVEWRLGMPELAPFVDTLDEGDRRRLSADALESLGPSMPELVRTIIVITATV